MIADSDEERCDLLRRRFDIYKYVYCTGTFFKERDLLEKTWLERPDVVLIYVGGEQLNAFSSFKKD